MYNVPLGLAETTEARWAQGGKAATDALAPYTAGLN